MQGLDTVLAGRVRAGLQIGLVELHDVRARGEQVGDLLPDHVGVGQGDRAAVGVVVVLCLLGHRERTRHGDLDRAVGVLAEEPHVLGLDRRRAGEMSPAMRGTGLGWPDRSRAVPGLSMSTPSSAVAKWLE